MRMTWKALALAGAAGLAVCAAEPARADVIYTWNGSPSFYFGNGALTPSVTLRVADAAVENGSFKLRSLEPGYQPIGGPAVPPAYSGDVQDFISFTATGLSVATLSNLASYNVFNLAFTFNASGSITADTVTWFGPDTGGQISGDGAFTTGTIQSDYPGCGPKYAGGLCGTVSGSWTETIVAPVPEPASLALLGVGVIGLALARRRTSLPAV